MYKQHAGYDPRGAGGGGVEGSWSRGGSGGLFDRRAYKIPVLFYQVYLNVIFASIIVVGHRIGENRGCCRPGIACIGGRIEANVGDRINLARQ